VLLGSAGPVCAGNAAFEINDGVGQSDNVKRTATDTTEDTVASAGLLFSYDERSARLEADVVGNLSYREFLDDTYDSELLGNLHGNARAAILPEKLSWALSDDFGQVLIDPFVPATPDNRENLNYLSTGPDLRIALGSQTRADIGLRYALADYENSPLDSRGLLGEGGLTRAFSERSSLGLFLRHQQLEYDTAPEAFDFDQSQAFLRYDALGARTRLRIDAGRDEIDRDGADTQGGFLVRVDAERRMTSRTTLSLRAARQHESSGSAFAGEQSGGGIALDASGSRQTFEPFLNERLDLSWRFTGSRTEFTLFADRGTQSYEDRPEFDQTFTSYGASMRRALTPLLSLDFDVRLSRSEFEQPGADYEDLGAGASLEWRPSRATVVRLAYSHDDRDSDSAFGGYTESRILLTVGYAHGAPRDRLLGTRFAVDDVAGAE
jgi:hypothetical protein